jgi:hypothetical protein
MTKDLYFLSFIAGALQQSDPKPALERAFEKIIELGQQPEYAHGFRQFKQFMAVLAERVDAYSKTTEFTIGEVWKDSAFQLYPGLIDDDQTEISNLVEFIRSHPESHERFDRIFREISMPDTGSLQLKIIINRNGEDICSIPVGDDTFLTKINDLMPGLYDVKLNTGRILWQGELTDRDLLWTAAFPETDMAMAADTGDAADHATKELRLLSGGLIIRVIPGLEGGCIDIEIRN